MEFADAINGRASSAAVNLTRHVRAERLSLIAKGSALIGARTICTSVADSADTREHEVFATHGQLVEKVVFRDRSFGVDGGHRTIDAADCFPDRND